MTLRISDVRMAVDDPEARLPDRLAAVLGVRPGDLLRWRILRKSLDARDKDALQFVYTAEVAVPDEERRLAARAGRGGRVDRYEEEPFIVPPPGTRPLPHRPVVIGSGPGGLAAAWFLAEQGYRPLVLERGRAVREPHPRRVAPSTPAARSTPKATTCSARAAPARSATAS